MFYWLPAARRRSRPGRNARQADLVIAADRGLLHAAGVGLAGRYAGRRHGFAAPNKAAVPPPAPASRSTAPAAKDETDLEMALNARARRRRQPRSASAGHSAGASTTCWPMCCCSPVRILRGRTWRSWTAPKPCACSRSEPDGTRRHRPGDLLSLCPWAGMRTACGRKDSRIRSVTKPLPPGSGRGVSNLFSGTGPAWDYDAGCC